MISAPTVEEHPTVLADWLELHALASTTKESLVLSLVDIRDIGQDEEAEDIGDFDAISEETVVRVTAEIEARIEKLGSAYPFTIVDGGRVLRYTETKDLGGLAYLVCLFMSHVTQSPLLDNFNLVAEAQSGRNIFQLCATLAAAGKCEGPAISFGWPRIDRTSFARKLVETYQVFGDGTPRREPLAAAPDHVKDGGIDIISWQRNNDDLPGGLYLLGQVASGHNWPDKTVLHDIGQFHWAWFEVQPASAPHGAMFVPFCITIEADKEGKFSEQEVLINKMQWLTQKFGYFMYRYRLPFYANKAAQLHANGTAPIEGLDQFDTVFDWVEGFKAVLARV